jgi:hypothetical protein
MSAGADVISYTVTNACGTAYATAAITVNPLPNAGAVTGLTSVCAGSNITLSDPTGDGGGIWVSSNSSASVSGGLVTGMSAGIDTSGYHVSNGCGTAAATYSITVLPLPVAGAITGAGIVCVGATIPLTDAATGGLWASSNSNATVAAGVVTGMASGTAIISYSVTNSCGVAVATHAVTIASFVPSTGPITGSTMSFCAGTTTTLSEATTGGVWSSSNGSATVSSSGVVTGLSGGVDTISYSIINGCGAAVSTYTVSIGPLPNPGKILGLGEACPGFTITLADYVAGGTWSSSDGSIATVNSSGIVKGLQPGSAFIIYTTTNACGNSTIKVPFTVLDPSECVAKVASPGLSAGGAEMLRISPNPNNGSFTINVTSAVNEDIEVSITDMTGRKVKAFTIPIAIGSNKEQEVKLDVPAGVYFVVVNSSSGRQVQKVVVN